MSQTTELLTRMYAAYAVMDIATIDALIAEDSVMHISGHHPLSGDKVGKARSGTTSAPSRPFPAGRVATRCTASWPMTRAMALLC
jgi:ketosteroid isomerase-like protein